ncbi:MAG: type II secretion system F family protein [Propionibacteriaceae bacterium]
MSAVVLTIWTITRRRLASRKARERHTQLAQAALALAGEVDVGRIPREALEIVAQDYPLLAEPLAAARLGGNVADSLRQLALVPGMEGADELAAAWQLGERVGAPLAMSFRQVATSLTQQRALSRVVVGELAAPRATGRLLAGLPLAGLGLGYGLGGDPLRFLLTNAIGNALLLTGVALTCAGLLWSERLADKAGA